METCTPELRFIESSHTYLVREGAGWVKKPGISEIMKATHKVTDYTGIDPYYAQLGQAAALAIKLSCENDLETASLDEAVAIRFSAWRAFLIRTGYKALRWEMPLYSPSWDFCGTPDSYGELDGKKGLIEIKCTETKKPEWKKQLHAQRILCQDNGMPVEFLASLRLSKDGSPRLDYFDLERGDLWPSVMIQYWDETKQYERRRSERRRE